MEITYKLVTRVTQYFSFPNKHEKWGHLGFLERGGGGGILAKGEGMAPLTNYGAINSNDMYVF